MRETERAKERNWMRERTRKRGMKWNGNKNATSLMTQLKWLFLWVN